MRECATKNGGTKGLSAIVCLACPKIHFCMKKREEYESRTEHNVICFHTLLFYFLLNEVRLGIPEFEPPNGRKKRKGRPVKKKILSSKTKS